MSLSVSLKLKILWFCELSASRDEFQVSPAELAVLDSLLSGGRALSLKVSYMVIDISSLYEEAGDAGGWGEKAIFRIILEEVDLGPVHTKRQRQCCDNSTVALAIHTVFIENNGVAPEWVCNPLLSVYPMFSMRTVL